MGRITGGCVRARTIACCIAAAIASTLACSAILGPSRSTGATATNSAVGVWSLTQSDPNPEPGHQTFSTFGVSPVDGQLTATEPYTNEIFVTWPGFSMSIGSNEPNIQVGHYGPAAANVDTNSEQCDASSGSFDIHRLDTDDAGSITHLWFSFVASCIRGEVQRGEVRYNAGDSTSDGLVSPAAVQFADTDRGSTDREYVYARHANGATGGLAPALTGVDSSDFSIAENSCETSDQPICKLGIDFNPTGPGPRAASLVIGGLGGGQRTVTLDGYAFPGTSRVRETRTSDGRTGTDIFQAPDNPLTASGLDRETARIDAGGYQKLELVAPAGGALVPGEYDDVTSTQYYSYGSGGSLSIPDTPCDVDTSGDFTINSIDHDRLGHLSELDADYDVSCGTSKIDGSVKFRARDDTEAPARVSDLDVSRSGSDAEVTWTPPTDTDLDRTEIRFEQSGQPISSISGGRLGFAGSRDSTDLTGIDPDLPLSVSAFTVDHDGNVGAARSTVAAPPSPSTEGTATVTYRGRTRLFVAGEGNPQPAFVTAFAGKGSSNGLLKLQMGGGEFADGETFLDIQREDGPLVPGTYVQRSQPPDPDRDLPATDSRQPQPLRSAEIYLDNDESNYPSCDIEAPSRVDLKEYETNASNQVTRLWLDYEVDCRYGGPVTGEIRIGPPTDLVVTPESIRWPDQYIDTHGRNPVPVMIYNRGLDAVTPSGANLAGIDRDEFSVLEDRCTGRRIDPGDSCEILLSFDPSSGGPKDAHLELGAGDGVEREIDLSGFGIQGKTGWTIDYTGGPRDQGAGPEIDLDEGDGTYMLDGGPSFEVNPRHGSQVYEASISGWDPQLSGPQQIDDSNVTGGVRFRFPEGPTCRFNKPYEGTVDVREDDLSPLGAAHVDAVADVHCPSDDTAFQAHFQRESLLGQDTVAPSAASDLEVVRDGNHATLSWRNPDDPDFDRVVVSYLQGPRAPEAADGARLAYAGAGESTDIGGLRPGEPLAVSVFSVDQAGNIGSPTSSPLAPPQLKSSDPASVGNGDPTVSGFAPPGSTVRFYEGYLGGCSGSPVATSTAAELSNGVITPVPKNAVTELRATSESASGAVSACSTPLVYEEDSKDPPPPYLERTSPESPSSSNKTYVYGASSDGYDSENDRVPGTIELFDNPECSGTPLGRGHFRSDIDTGSFGVQIQVPDDSQTDIYGRGIDQAGNLSPCSTRHLTYVEDSTPPAAPVITGSTPTSPSSDREPLIQGTAEKDGTVRLVDSRYCAPYGYSDAFGTSADFASPGIRILAPLDQSVTLAAVAVDEAGNASPCSATFTYTHHSVPPPAPSFSSTTPASPSESQTAVVRGVTAKRTTVDLFTNAQCTGSPYATDRGIDTFATTGIQITAPPGGEIRVWAQAVNEAGQRSPCSSESIAYAQHSPPQPPQLTFVTNSPAQTDTPVIRGTGPVGSTIDLYLGRTCSGEPIAEMPVTEFAGDGATANVAHDTETDFSAAAVDSLGVRSACSGSVGFINDLTPPDTTFASQPPSVTRDGHQPLEIRSPEMAGVEFQCRIDRGSWNSCAAHDHVELSEGHHRVSARAVDSAGNFDPTPATATITVDTTKPRPSILRPFGERGRDVSIRFRGDEASLSFECRLDERRSKACQSPATYSNLAVGRHTFRLTASDRAGNISVPKTVSFRIRRKARR